MSAQTWLPIIKEDLFMKFDIYHDPYFLLSSPTFSYSDKQCKKISFDKTLYIESRQNPLHSSCRQFWFEAKVTYI
jgi:hypothetical protein